MVWNALNRGVYPKGNAMKILLTLITIAASLLAGAVHASSFPTRPITLIVPYSPGGGTDVMARLLAQQLSSDLDASVIVENRPGASGNIGTGQVANAEADGYTLLFTSSGHVINPSLFKSLPFDPIAGFSPVAQVASGPSVLVVNTASGIENVDQLIERGASGKELTFGSAGLGQPTHLAAEKFANKTGIKTLHIPYKGSGAAEIALAGGEVDFLIDSIPAALPMMRTQKTRALAVTGAERFPLQALESTPTLQELGMKDFEFSTWWGVLAPAGTPDAHIDMLSQSIAKAMASAEMTNRFVEIGAVPTVKQPAAFQAYMKKDLAAYRNLIETIGLEGQ